MKRSLSQNEIDSLAMKIDIAARNNGLIVIVGWKASNHDAFTRSLSERRVRFIDVQDKSSTELPYSAAIVLKTRFIGHASIGKCKTAFMPSRVFTTGQIKLILRTCEECLMASAPADTKSPELVPYVPVPPPVLPKLTVFLPMPQPKQEGAVKKATDPVVDDAADPITLILAGDASCQPFFRAFRQGLDENGWMGRYDLGKLIRHFFPTAEAQRVMAIMRKKGMLVAHTSEGKSRSGYYGIGPTFPEVEGDERPPSEAVRLSPAVKHLAELEEELEVIPELAEKLQVKREELAELEEKMAKLI